MTFTSPLKRLTKLALSTLLLILVGVGLLTARLGAALAAEASPPMVPCQGCGSTLKAVVAMEQLDQMRISLASTLEGRNRGAHHRNDEGGVQTGGHAGHRHRQGERLAGAPGGQQGTATPTMPPPTLRSAR